MLSHAVPNGAKTYRHYTAAKSVHMCWQVLRAIYFWALDQDNNNNNYSYYYYYYKNNNKDRRRRRGGGGSRIATVPEMLRLASAVNNTKTSIILVCTLTRLNSVNAFWECTMCQPLCYTLKGEKDEWDSALHGLVGKCSCGNYFHQKWNKAIPNVS